MQITLTNPDVQKRVRVYDTMLKTVEDMINRGELSIDEACAYITEYEKKVDLNKIDFGV